VTPPRAFASVALAVALAATTAAADRHPRSRAPEDPHPRAVTQRFALKLAAGSWALADYVDPAVGVVYLDVAQGLSDRPRRGAAELACGPAIAKRLKQARRVLHDKLLGDHATGGLTCSNRPGPPTCSAGGATEGDSLIRLVFRDGPDRGVRLTAIIVDDDYVHADQPEIDRNRAAQAHRIAALAAPGCPAPAP